MSMWRFMGGMGCLIVALDCLATGLAGGRGSWLPADLSWTFFFATVAWLLCSVAVFVGAAR